MNPCPFCLTPMASARRVQCGARACARAYNRTRNRIYQRRYRAEYAARGESYRGRWGWSSYGSQWRRRARTTAGDVIDRDLLGERDGWVCGLCTVPIDRNLTYPHPMSASTDHVVPLALDGAHAWGNVQIAHNRCNVSKRHNRDWAPEVAA